MAEHSHDYAADAPVLGGTDTGHEQALDRLFGAWAGADEVDDLIRAIYEARSDL